VIPAIVLVATEGVRISRFPGSTPERIARTSLIARSWLLLHLLSHGLCAAPQLFQSPSLRFCGASLTWLAPAQLLFSLAHFAFGLAETFRWFHAKLLHALL
jgi:hypothetical protein